MAKGLKARPNSSTDSIETGFQPSDFVALPNLVFAPQAGIKRAFGPETRAASANCIIIFHKIR